MCTENRELALSESLHNSCERVHVEVAKTDDMAVFISCQTVINIPVVKTANNLGLCESGVLHV